MPQHLPAPLSWKLFLWAIFGLFAIGMAVGFILAGRGGARLVDRDYYEQGKHYGEQSVRVQRAAEAGWRFRVTRQGGDVLVVLTDREGRGVSDLEVGFRQTVDRGTPPVPLQHLGEGRYLLPYAALAGEGQGTVVASSPQAFLSSRIRVLDR
jgi:nitrogen fixation protein FixH